MTSLRQPGTLGMLLSLVPAGLALTQPFALEGIDPVVTVSIADGSGLLIVAALVAAALISLRKSKSVLSTLALVAVVALGGGLLLAARPSGDAVPAGGFWLLLVAVFMQARTTVQRFAALEGGHALTSAATALFGAWGIYFWQILVRAFDVPRVLLPAPTDIVVALVEGSSG